ncbi:MAG: hypothetical protein LBT59_04080 [Clostridiales bacterium]|nr:hypothetical protein [Clostridiales bacterium]
MGILLTGKASDASIGVYDDFSSKYIETYYYVINQYVNFLRDAVVINYAEDEMLEMLNMPISEIFK